MGKTKDLHTADYTQLYDFLKYNQNEVDELKVKRLAKTQDPLALMANSNNLYVFPAPHQDQSSFNQNYLQQPIPNTKDITDPTTAMNMALTLMAKAFKLNYSTLTNNNQIISSNLRNRQIAQSGMNMGQDRQMQMGRGNDGNQFRQQIAQPSMNMGQDRQMHRVGGNGGNQFRQYAGQNAGNLNGYNVVQYIGNQAIQNAVQNLRVQNVRNQNARTEGNAARQNGNQIRCYNCRGVGHYVRNYTVRPRRRDVAFLQTQLLIAQKEEAGIQLQAEDAPVYDTDGSAEVHENCDDNEIFNMFTQEEQYTELLESISESHQVLQNDNDVISEDTSVEQAKFVGDFKSLANKDDASLAKQKALELEIECLLKAVVSQDIMIIVQNESVVDTSDLQTELEQNLPKIGKTNALSKPVTSNSVSTPQESKSVNNDKVIVPGMFRINPSKTSREEKHVPNTISASTRKTPITISQPPIISKKDVNSELNGLSSIGINNTKTRRPQPRSNTKHDRVPSGSKSSRSKNKEAEVEEHHSNLLLSTNNKHISSACNNIQIDSHDVISKVVCATCLKCLISINHDKCLRNYVKGKNSHGKKQKAKVSFKENQMKYQPKVTKLKKVEHHKSLATTKLRKPRFFLRWSPTGRLFDQEGKLAASSNSESQYDCSNGDNACTSNAMEPKIKRFPNSTSLLDSCYSGFGDLQWGNILITRVYFVVALGHNLFSVGQFCYSDLEVTFRRNACFIRNLEGVDLLKGDRSTNLYTINLHEIASVSPINLMARASSTKSWLWHQRLSHLNFNAINDLARNDLVAGLPKFKYHKEHLCPSCEQGKSKRASHLPKPVPNSRQRLHFLHTELCGPMRIASINGKRYVLVIVDDYSRYTWVHFLRSKDEAPEVIIKFLKRITVLL
nr:retrovirus-related Pol polyprotein from transposon TNT 1-94 [Tanacetum cinerariifolium]